MTPEESAIVLATKSRMTSHPSAPRLSQVDRYPQASCGVWRIRVGRDGKVRALELTRSGGERALVNQLEPWLRKSRYQPAKKPWSGLVVVRLP
jgi:hypothetical protein